MNENEQTAPKKPRQLNMADIVNNTEPPPAIQPLEGGPNFMRPWKQPRFKIFLGAAAGVGKTYAMLEEAQQLKASGVDVVAGYVELHGRKETEVLVGGLEVIPRHKVEYRGTTLDEMDTEAIIRRNPQIVLVDELAHTNAPGSKYAKRYEDIEEILKSGIDVYSTVNVQHLESLNDKVFELTTTRVRETFPDRILNLASEIILIDLPPEDLRTRIQQGKVYRPEKIEQALNSFFRTSNLTILRELALRETADAVHASDSSNRDALDEETPTLNAFVLICVALKAEDTRVIRQGWRFAQRLNAPAEVINISRDDERTFNEEKRIAPLRLLAHALKLPFHELKGDAVEQIVQEAHNKQATLIVLGESTRNTWREILFGSFTDRVLRRMDGVDIYIVGDPSKRPR